MDITTQNFEAEKESIKEVIQGCDFIAMDTEFTGLDIGKKAKRLHTDSSRKLYKKHKFVCQKFQAIQVGL